MPEELDTLERQIRQLEIERGSQACEDDEAKLKELTEIANLAVQRDTLQAEMEGRKEIEKIQNARAAIEQLKVEAEQAERNSEYGRVAEIRYGKNQEQESLIADSSRQSADDQ